MKKLFTSRFQFILVFVLISISSLQIVIFPSIYSTIRERLKILLRSDTTSSIIFIKEFYENLCSRKFIRESPKQSIASTLCKDVNFSGNSSFFGKK